MVRRTGTGYRAARIDGFTVMNGHAGYGTVSFGAAGIRCFGSPTIANCTIRGNTAIGNGGGIYCGYGPATFTNNTIQTNQAVSGAGIYCDGSSPTIVNNAIRENAASDSGGGIYPATPPLRPLSTTRSPGIARSMTAGESAAHQSSP